MSKDVTFKDLLSCLINPIYADKKSLNYTYNHGDKVFDLIIERTDLTEVLLFKIIKKSSPNNVDNENPMIWIFELIISHGRISVEINNRPFGSISITDKISEFKHVLDNALLDTNDNDGIIIAMITATKHYQSRCEENSEQNNLREEKSDDKKPWKSNEYLKLEKKINELLQMAEDMNICCLVLTDTESYNYDAASSYILKHTEKSYHEWVKKEYCTDLNFVEFFSEVKMRYYQPSNPQQRYMMEPADEDDVYTNRLLFDIDEENNGVVTIIRFYEMNPKTFVPNRIMKMKCYDLIKGRPENSLIEICPVSEAAGGDLTEHTRFISAVTLVNDDSEHPWYEEFNIDGSRNNFIKQLLDFEHCL